MDSDDEMALAEAEADVDQYHESDKADDISDPNLDRARLYQDVVCLPLKLQKQHYEEGLIYTMTLESGKKNPM